MFTKLLKSIYFKPMLLLMACAMIFMSFTMPGQTVIIKAGTNVPLELISTLNSSTAKTGQMVDFRVTNDIKVDNKTVIEAGSIAQGQIVRAKKNGLLGAEGEVEVSIRTVRAIDGTNVYLSNNSLNDEGSNKLGISLVLTFLCLFGFLIKGGKAEIPAGTQIIGVVSSNTEIQLN